MSEFTEWDSFYVIVGSAAGALVGLQFVVMTLIAEKPVRDIARAGAAFATPTIVHFSAVLFFSAMMRVPWPETMYAALVWGLSGAAGLVYTAFVGRRMIKQTAYQPGFEDWLFHVALPLASYALLGSAFFIEKANIIAALFAVAGCSLLLLLVGIHNAWDAVAYHVFVNIRGTHDEAARKNRTRKE